MQKKKGAECVGLLGCGIAGEQVKAFSGPSCERRAGQTLTGITAFGNAQGLLFTGKETHQSGSYPTEFEH